MKTNDLKKQLAAVMAVALTFSSVPVVSADNSLAFIPDGDIIFSEDVDAPATGYTLSVAPNGANANVVDGVVYIANASATGAAQLTEDATVTPTATPAGADLPAITYRSSDTNIVTVDADGKIYGMSAGSATIYAESTVNSSAYSQSVNVIVKDTAVITVTADEEAAKAKKVWDATNGRIQFELEEVNAGNIATYLTTNGLIKVSTAKGKESNGFGDPVTEISVADGGSEDMYTVTVKLTDDAVNKNYETDIQGSATIKVTRVLKTIDASTLSKTNFSVKVNNLDAADSKTAAAKAAIEADIAKVLKDTYGAEATDYTLTVAKNGTTDPAAKFDTKLELTEDGKKKFKFADSKTEITGTYTVAYTNDLVPLTVTTSRPSAATLDSEYHVFKNVAVTGTDEAKKNAAIEELKSAYSTTLSAKDANGNTQDAGTNDYVDYVEPSVTAVKFDSNGGEFTVSAKVIDAQNKNYSIGTNFTQKVKVEYAASTKQTLDPNLYAEQSSAEVGGSAVTPIKVDTTAETAADKEAAALKLIDSILEVKGTMYDATEKTATNPYGAYTISVAAKGTAGTDARTVFTVTLTLVDTEGYALTSGQTTYSEDFYVSYVNTAAAVTTTIKPVIVAEDSYTVSGIAKNLTDAQVNLAVKEKLLKEIKLTGVEKLTENVDYTFDLVPTKINGTAYKATFKLLTTGKYAIDPTCKPTASVVGGKNDLVTKDITVTVVKEAVEIAPAFKSILDGEATTVEKYVSNAADYKDTTDAIKAELEATSDNKWYKLEGVDNLKAADYEIKVENTGSDNKPVFVVSFVLKSTDTYTVKAPASITFTINYAVTKTIKPSPVNFDVSFKQSDFTDNYADAGVGASVKLAKTGEAKLKALGVASVKASLQGMIEGTDYVFVDGTDSFWFTKANSGSPNDYEKVDQSGYGCKIKLLDTKKYAYDESLNANVSKTDNDGDTLQLYVNSNVPTVVDQLDIVQVLSAPKEMEVEVYTTDTLAERYEKAKAYVKEHIDAKFYGAGKGEISLVRGWDKDYDFSFWGAPAAPGEDGYNEAAYNAAISKPTPIFTCGIYLTTAIGAKDYNLEDSVNAGTTEKPNTVSAVASITTTVTYKEVEKPDVETDKWVKAEDGTYSYTASKSAAPGDAGKLVLDLGEVDLATVSNITATLKLSDGGVANGCLGATSSAEEWTTAKWSSEDAKDGVVTVSLDVDGVTEAGAELQLWWANADTTVTLNSINVKTGEVASTIPEITKVSAGTERVGLNWTEVKGATGYGVFVKEGKNGKWTRYCMTSKNAKFVSGLTPGQTYAFAVKAYVNGKWSDVSNVVSAVPTSAKPIITAANAAGKNKVALNWTPTTNATGYGIYVYKDGKWERVGMRGVTGMYVSGLEAGTTYRFAVKAYVNGKWTTITADDIVSVTTTK